jgi:hypothetical protein
MPPNIKHLLLILLAAKELVFESEVTVLLANVMTCTPLTRKIICILVHLFTLLTIFRKPGKPGKDSAVPAQVRN